MGRGCYIFKLDINSIPDVGLIVKYISYKIVYNINIAITYYVIQINQSRFMASSHNVCLTTRLICHSQKILPLLPITTNTAALIWCLAMA